MKPILIVLTLLLVALVIAGCSQDKPAETTLDSILTDSETSIEVPDDNQFMVTSLKALTGLNILKVSSNGNQVAIDYEQITDDSQAELVQCWLNIATVVMSFMEAPGTITIVPFVEGTAVARITLESEDVASMLAGDMSLQEILSRIIVREP
ncbi:MAG: hypothetical protein JW762_03230 [Dehalococcoidales bacterium]|nr:hypothetical protein [Dehalococcoidales bacterium]